MSETTRQRPLADVIEALDRNATEDIAQQRLMFIVADAVAEALRMTFDLSKISKRDAALILTAYGARPITVERHAKAVAGLIRVGALRHRTLGG